MKKIIKLSLVYLGLIVLVFYQANDPYSTEQKSKIIFEYQQF